ncbi:MAG: sucrase ferredoxin [Bryobacteraceae bacterium]
MKQERFFCAAESRANGEAIYGTVARIRSWLLLEHPGAWRRNAVQHSTLLSLESNDHIRRPVIDRALLIRKEHHRAGPLHCFFVRSCDDLPSATRYMIPDHDDLRIIEGGGEPFNELMFAVCTHGRHDKCCAKFGIPVWSAFRKVAATRAWQCSHVGGDRFAGNVILFPYGVYYGRVRPEHVSEIVHRSDAGEVWLPGYRGRCCFPRPVQVAEYFLRAESGRLRIDEFRPVETVRITAENTRVMFRGRSDRKLHTVEFVTRTDALHHKLTCEATEPSTIAQYELRNYTAA